MSFDISHNLFINITSKINKTIMKSSKSILKLSILVLLTFSTFVFSEDIVQKAPKVNEAEPVDVDYVSGEENINNLPSYLDTLPYVNLSKPVVNATVENSTEVNNVSQKFVTCLTSFGGPEVQIVNDTELIKLLIPDPNITSKETAGKCICVLFYSKYCPFSSLAAPHFNALPRAFPDIKMVAINAMMYHLFNTQNGIVGVPSLLLFHNGKVVGKFNESDYTLEQFSRFISKNTGITAEEKSFVTSADFSGPVSSVPSKDTDIFLAISWSFIIVCAVYYFTQSKWWQWIVETVQNNWRESEAQAQHEHAD